MLAGWLEGAQIKFGMWANNLVYQQILDFLQNGGFDLTGDTSIWAAQWELPHVLSAHVRHMTERKG